MILLKNKKATFNYEVLKRYTSGISLIGSEVKSLKNKKGSFEGSFVSILKSKKNINKNELVLKNFFIPPYQEKNTLSSYDPYGERKLLLKKDEIKQILKKMKSDRLTLIPISFFVERNLIKLEFALARGKRKFDKREDIKKHDQNRDLERDIKVKFR